MLNRNNKQAGFTLIEMLVAVVVLSIGLLGLAGLQAQTLQFNKSAELRSQATILAYDMIDRMRANRTTAEAGSYDTAFGDLPAGGPDCAAAACTAADFAQYDIDQWLCSLGSDDAACAGIEGLLLEGQGEIVRAGSVVTVRIMWVDDRTNDDDGTVNLPTSRFAQVDVSTIL